MINLIKNQTNKYTFKCNLDLIIYRILIKRPKDYYELFNFSLFFLFLNLYKLSFIFNYKQIIELFNNIF
jgi:hypothetical protein